MNAVDEAHAAVLDWILAMRRGSPEANEAHRAYQATRLAMVPKLLKQKALLERALLTPSLGPALDPQVTALDAEMARDWGELEMRLAREAA